MLKVSPNSVSNIRYAQRGVEIARYCFKTYKNIKIIQKDGPKSPAADELVRDTTEIGVIALKMAQFLSARGDVIDASTLTDTM